MGHRPHLKMLCPSPYPCAHTLHAPQGPSIRWQLDLHRCHNPHGMTRATQWRNSQVPTRLVTCRLPALPASPLWPVSSNIPLKAPAQQRPVECVSCNQVPRVHHHTITKGVSSPHPCSHTMYAPRTTSLCQLNLHRCPNPHIITSATQRCNSQVPNVPLASTTTVIPAAPA